jgi:hypothetical protein
MNNNKAFLTREYKRKTRLIIAKSMLELAEIQRIERHKKDERLGYFTENFTTFVTGEEILSLKKKLK